MMKIWYEIQTLKSEWKLTTVFSLTTLAMVPSIHAQVNFQLQPDGRPFMYEDNEEGSGVQPLALLKGSAIQVDPTRACWTCQGSGHTVLTSFIHRQLTLSVDDLWTKNASSFTDCYNNGNFESCNAAEDSCMLEVRRYDSTTRITTGCMPQTVSKSERLQKNIIVNQGLWEPETTKLCRPLSVAYTVSTGKLASMEPSLWRVRLSNMLQHLWLGKWSEQVSKHSHWLWRATVDNANGNVLEPVNSNESKWLEYRSHCDTELKLVNLPQLFILTYLNKLQPLHAIMLCFMTWQVKTFFDVLMNETNVMILELVTYKL